MRSLVVGLLCAFSVSCFNAPSYDGRQCDQQGECPTGYYCSSEMLCRAGVPPAPTDASTIDAEVGLDAGPMDVPDTGIQIQCTETATRACYDGPANTRGEGICRDGTQTCTAGAWGNCEGSFLPTAETCDGVDEDCDGTDDNGTNECGGACALSVPVGTACDAATPDDLDACLDDAYACDGINAVVCVNAGTDGDGDNYSVGAQTCDGDCRDDSGTINPGEVEICNGFDDDCDVDVDEGCNYDPAACQVTPPPIAQTTVSAPIPVCSTNYFVSPTGDDGNDGLTAGTPLLTIDAGLALALPGDCVNLAAGDYPQNISSVRSGTAGSPIMITGPATASVHGTGRGYIVLVNHDYLYFNGFTLDGLVGDPTDVSGYQERLMRIYSEVADVGVVGIVIRGMTFKNALKGCLRVSYLSTDHEIVENTFTDCGRNYELAGLTHTEGDGIHIGTFPPQLSLNPTPVPDTSGRIWIHDNVFTDVTQCVEVLSSAVGSVIEDNECVGTGSILNSGGFEIAGNWNVIRRNSANDGAGSGIRAVNSQGVAAICNTIEGNAAEFNERTGFWIEAAPQVRICGNTALGNVGGANGGAFTPLYDVLAPCP